MESQNSRTSRQWLRAIFAAGIQAFVYAILLAAMTQAVVHQAARPELADQYGEQSLTEWLQVAFLGAGAALLIWKATVSAERRPLEMLLAGMLVIAFIREFDWAFETYVGQGGWQAAAALAAAVTAVLAYRRRHFLAPQIEEFLKHPSYGIMLCGFLVVFVFSRIIGQEVFWRHILGDNYLRVAKNAAEENTELLGYFLLLVSVIEWVRSRPAKASVTQERVR